MWSKPQVMSGPASPASSNTDGSRRGLWATPKTGDDHATLHHPQRSDGGQPNLAFQIERQDCAKHKKGDMWSKPQVMSGPASPASSNTDGSRRGSLAEWRTPTVAEEKNQGTSTQIYLQNQVGATEKNWATPRAGKTTDENPETWAARQAKGDVATMPLTAQVKAWATPTPWQQEESLESFEARRLKNAAKGYNGNGQGTPLDMMVKSTTGKLNPRWVETLMGLPVGWVMPSCASPVTIALTNSACSETASCQPPPSGHSAS
jgi:hypothetical protein